jgi:4-hydroxy-tetrahydrodipicolinate synthase
MCIAAIAGHAQQAMAIQRQLLSLHKNMFTESNPIPVKWAANQMGLCGPTLRLPMTPFSSHLHPALETAMRGCGVI